MGDKSLIHFQYQNGMDCGLLSEIRAIQRRGRTGRFADGRILELITKDTLDETSLFISQRKEEKMRAGITGMDARKALS